VGAFDDDGREFWILVAFDPDRTGDLGVNAPHSRISPDERDDLNEPIVGLPRILGQSTQVRDVCRMIGLVAATDTTVLIQGESGTGKELVAQAIHFHSHRARNALVKVNCAALTETLLESELFGHKKGAFTGAIQDRKGRFKLSDRGTIILDEIGCMSLSGQAKLLRVLEENEFEPVGESVTMRVDVRVIAVTNIDLLKGIGAGTFREDLYYRLNAFPIRLPPLRERRIDIPILAANFLREYAMSCKKQITTIDPMTIAALMNHSWPGNIRELANVIEYAVILEKGDSLSVQSLPENLRATDKAAGSMRERLERSERQMILEALSASGWVKTRAAALLGIDRRNLGYFLQKHGIGGNDQGTVGQYP
jgi:transcriptional regulator with GAF, ATPase, and Fis domain